MTLEGTAPAAAATTAALRWGLVMQHLRQNNVSYLLLVAIAHMLGLLEPVIEHGQQICG
ncbi:hypothetical protein ACQZV8_20200 [Magnetococcales bacterium HHB-1]